VSTPARLVPIGQLGKTHGLKGEIRFRPYRPFFAKLLELNRSILVGPQPFTLLQARQAKSFMLLLFKGIESPEQAQVHVNKELWFTLDDVESITPAPFFFPEIWLGWNAFAEGILLGEVVDIIQTRANDILTVKKAGVEYLVPVIPEYILTINPENKTLLVKKPVLV
jgi:16S rRNA processing protein RimM